MRNALLVFLLYTSSTLPAQTGVSVITQHNDLKRTGWNDKETILNHAVLGSGKFGCIGIFGVDDEVYAQPLIVYQASIGSYTGSVLFTATVNNSIYAFNAADPSQAAALWQANLNPAGQRAPNISDLTDTQYGAPCGGNYKDFSGRFGILGTPVIDTLSMTLYVVTKTIDGSGNFYSYFNALDIQTGQHKAGSPHRIMAQATGTGDGSINGTLSYDAKYQNQRPALLLYQNTVYVASASHCDWGPYHGWVLGFDAATLALKYTYNVTPNGWAGGIWMAGQGPSVGDDGNIYVVTGNGTTSADNTNLTGGRSESLLKLSPQLNLLDWFTPSNYDYLDQYDLDYGSDGALIVPNTSLTISGSKEGISYLVDYTNMGRYNATNSQVKDTLEFNPNRQGYVHVHGSPIYAHLGTGEFVYAWAETFKLRQFTFDRNTKSFADTYKQGQRNLDNGMPGAMLSVSSNGADTSSAIVWACFPTAGNANNMVRPGTIAAYRANDVSSGELWNSDDMAGNVMGKFAKFNSPTVANGKVYVPTFSKAIKVYGIICNNALTNLQYGNGSGLKGEYFSNSTALTGFGAANRVTLDEAINFNWGNGSPATTISNDVFKVRWTGTLKALTDDTYTIYVNASDGIRLWINNELLIDSWSDKTITTHTTVLALQKTKDYDIRLEYYSNVNPAYCNLQWSAGGICRQVIPSTQLVAATAKCGSDGTGLQAEYFSNTAPADPFPPAATITQTEPTVNFNWAALSPAGISNDRFKARFTGYVQSLDSGNYTFYVTADDGIRLWVNNQLLIDRWVDQGSTEYSATVSLTQCSHNAIKIEYYENGGDAVCKLEWSGPAIGRQIIDSKQLFLTPAVVINNNGVKVYPNPTHLHQITAAVEGGLPAGSHVQVFNMLGQLVINNTTTISQPGSISIPLNLAAGVYILKLTSTGKTYSARFIVL